MEDDLSLYGSLFISIAVGASLLSVNAFASADNKVKTILGVLVATLIMFLLPSVFGDFSLMESVQLAR